eukprot:gene7966-1422_t
MLAVWISHDHYSQGLWQDDLQDGYGVCTCDNERIHLSPFTKDDRSAYQGEWVRGKRHGAGKYTHASAADTIVEYDGEFNNDMREGQGVAKLHNGDVYDGQVACSSMPAPAARLGVGTLRIAHSGNVYHGEWVRGDMTGASVCPNRVFKFRVAAPALSPRSVPCPLHRQVCRWAGNGTLIYVNGSRYMGSFKSGEKQGAGFHRSSPAPLHCMRYPAKSGGSEPMFNAFATGLQAFSNTLRGTRTSELSLLRDVFPTLDTSQPRILHIEVTTCRLRGEFHHNLRHGTGTLLLANNAGRYEGAWLEDIMHGQGEFVNNLSEGGIPYVYRGAFHHGKRHGSGECHFQNGDVYRGEFSDDYLHGQGVYSSKDGWIYEGNFVHDLKEDTNGLCRFATGDEFQGQWIQGQMHGIGVYKYSHGDMYTGDFAHNKFHGLGQVIAMKVDFRVALKKVFSSVIPFHHNPVVPLRAHNVITSQGKFIYANGDTYEGQFKAGKYSHGCLKKANGDNYSGEWQGQGAHTASGNYVYSGSLAQDQRQGEGECTYEDKSVYKGSWQQDKWHGHGTLSSAGTHYEGQFVMGIKQGYGRTTHANGNIHEGEYDSGQYDGWGVLKLSNADQYVFTSSVADPLDCCACSAINSLVATGSPAAFALCIWCHLPAVLLSEFLEDQIHSVCATYTDAHGNSEVRCYVHGIMQQQTFAKVPGVPRDQAGSAQKHIGQGFQDALPGTPPSSPNKLDPLFQSPHPQPPPQPLSPPPNPILCHSPVQDLPPVFSQTMCLSSPSWEPPASATVPTPPPLNSSASASLSCMASGSVSPSRQSTTIPLSLNSSQLQKPDQGSSSSKLSPRLRQKHPDPSPPPAHRSPKKSSVRTDEASQSPGSQTYTSQTVSSAPITVTMKGRRASVDRVTLLGVCP